MKGRTYLFLIILACLAKPSFADEADLKLGVQRLMKSLVQIGGEVRKRKDLSPIQAAAGNVVQTWFVPGAMFVPQKSLNKPEIKGWYPDETGHEDSRHLLGDLFSSLKTGETVVLKDKNFDPDGDLQDPCGIKGKWRGKWVLYQGDYLSDKGWIAGDPGWTGRPVGFASWTLIFFPAGGYPAYFGLRHDRDEWVIIAIADDRCEGGV